MVDRRTVIPLLREVLLKHRVERTKFWLIVMYSYIGRKLKKRDMRKLWIMRINVGK